MVDDYRPSPRRPSWLPLSSQVLLSALALVFLVISVGGAVWLSAIRDDSTAALRLRGERSADLVARAIARPLFDYDNQLVADIVGALADDPDIRGITVWDGDGATLVAIGPPDGASLPIIERVMTYGQRDEVVGRLGITLSTAGLEAEIRDIAGRGALALLALFTAVAVAIVASFRRLSLPIHDLGRVMLRLVAGSHRGTIPWLTRRDEIGDMARALDVFRRHADQIERMEAEKAAQMALRESEERLRSLVDGLPVMVLAIDTIHHRVVFANQAMRVEICAPGDDPVGLPLTAFLAPESAACVVAGEGEQDLEFTRHDGTTFWGQVAVRNAELGRRAVLLAGISDVTQRHRAQQQLIRAREQAQAGGGGEVPL